MTTMRSVQSLIDLTGRVVLVTGGAGHIGEAMCSAFAELGAAVAILDLEAVAAERACERLRAAHGTQALALGVDLADEEALRHVPAQVAARFGRLDVLVNNAALVGTSSLQGWATPFEQQRADTWRRALEINVTAPFVLVQAAAPVLREHRNGSVINVSSIYGMVGPDLRLYSGTSLGNPAAYAVSKGGLLQLTRWLATTLAPDIRVNAITVGGVWRNQPPGFVEQYVSRTPLGRMASEEDLKGAAAYLASDLSAYVTGANLVVDGGWTAW
jgi:NAD(P)-dependent dehydrogenase (short-subunit alcohol dehydrogenase family)